MKISVDVTDGNSALPLFKTPTVFPLFGLMLISRNTKVHFGVHEATVNLGGRGNSVYLTYYITEK